MTVSRKNSLLQRPGPVRTILQHFDVVISLQDKNVRCSNSLQNQLCCVPEVRQIANASRTGSDQETNRVLRIVRDGEGVDGYVPDGKAGTGGKEPAIKLNACLILDLF